MNDRSSITIGVVAVLSCAITVSIGMLLSSPDPFEKGMGAALAGVSIGNLLYRSLSRTPKE